MANADFMGGFSLWVDGEGKLNHTYSFLGFDVYKAVSAGMDIGRDNGGVVDLDSEDRAPYAFTGRINSVAFDLQPVSEDEAKSLREHHAHQSVGHGAADEWQPLPLSPLSPLRGSSGRRYDLSP